jgi:hypothetical protein
LNAAADDRGSDRAIAMSLSEREEIRCPTASSPQMRTLDSQLVEDRRDVVGRFQEAVRG